MQTSASLRSARSIWLAIFSTMPSAFIGTPARAAFMSFMGWPIDSYIRIAITSYAFTVPIAIVFNYLWLSYRVESRAFTAEYCCSFAFSATLFFWSIAGLTVSLFGHLPCSALCWLSSTLVFGLISAIAAAKWSEQGLKYLRLLD